MDNKEIQKTKRLNWKKSYFAVIGVFYLFQGFYSEALRVYEQHMMLDVWNFSESKVALVSALIILPNYLKMFTGLLSDRVPILGKRRSPYIIIGTFMYIPFFLLLTLITDFSIMWAVAMIFISFGWSLVDGTLDALSIDVSPESKLGMMSGVTWASRSVGSIVAMVGAGLLAAAVTWQYALLIIGAFAVMQGLSALLIKEPNFNKKDVRSFRQDKTAIVDFVKKPKSWLTIVFILLFNVATGIYALLPTIFAKLANMEVVDIMVYAAAAYGSAMVGVLIAGKISDKIGAKKLVVPVLIFFWLAVSMMFFVKPGMSSGMIWLIMIVFGLAMGASFVPTGRLSMEIANPEISGFVYAGMSSVSNLAQGAVASLVFAFFSLFMPLPYSIFPLAVFSIASCFLINKLDWWEPGKGENTDVAE